MTIFEKAGYTKDTKFRVLKEYQGLKAGDIVTLDDDNGTTFPRFKTECGRNGEMYLPECTYPNEIERI